MFISKPVFAGTMLLLVLLLQGCGRKGPLFMPQAPAKPAPAAPFSRAESTEQTQAVPVQMTPVKLSPAKLNPINRP
jgi:predicted small lipoprotein YifL